MSVLLGDLDRHENSVIDVYCSGVGCNRKWEVDVKDLIARAKHGRSTQLHDMEFNCPCGSKKWLPIIQPEVLASRKNK